MSRRRNWSHLLGSGTSGQSPDIKKKKEREHIQNTGQLILLVETDKYYTTRNATLEQFISITEMDQVFFTALF